MPDSIGHPDVTRIPLRLVDGDPLVLTFAPPAPTAPGAPPAAFPAGLVLTLELGAATFPAVLAPDRTTTTVTLTPDQVATVVDESDYRVHWQAPGDPWSTRVLEGPVIRG